MPLLEKWEYSKGRYESMYNVLIEFKKGMSSDGNKSLQIVPCTFCPLGCDACDWKNIFNLCKHKGGPGNEQYDRFSGGINESIKSLRKIILMIDMKIEELKGDN